jgi:phytoene desaturase
MQNSKKVIVIGSGIGGLATAIRLAVQGHSVTVFEKNSYPGGKLSHFKIQGYHFDAGPSLFTQPQNIEALFELCGEDIQQYFTYQKREIACRYFFDSGKTVNAYVQPQLFADQLADAFGENPQKVLDYLAIAQKSYENIGTLFLDHSLHNKDTYSSQKTWNAIKAVKWPFITRTLHAYNTSFFTQKETVQIFDRFATYNGSNPYKAPAMLSMIPHLEQNEGTFYPLGGMISITNALYLLALNQGVTFCFNKAVSSIVTNEKRVQGVIVASETKYGADIVVSNMDAYYTYYNLLAQPVNARKILRQERSSSAIIFYWGMKKKYKQLDLHNIFFSNDYRAEFDHISDKNSLYEDPTVYINITSKVEPNQAPAGCDNWFVMVNAPHDSGQDWEALRKSCRASILTKISKILGEDVEPYIEVEEYLDPPLIDQKTMSYTGSLYGTSSNSKFAAFMRHSNFSKEFEGLYFVGGSVHPGGGIPLCLKSAKIVANDIGR